MIILSLGGSDMINGSRKTELADIAKVSSNIFAVIDSERNQMDEAVSKERQKFKDICAELKIDCHIVKNRATENYFTTPAINAGVGKPTDGLQPFEKLGSKWSKSDNWKIAAKMSRADIENTDLGQFILKI